MKNRTKFPAYSALMGLLIAVGFLLPGASFAGDSPWSTQVDVWTPPFNTELKREVVTYTPLATAQKEWRIFVFIPHLKDSYWLSANYGLVDEARRQGVRLIISEAGGYGNLDIQRRQIEECLASQKPDGIIIGAISDTGLNDLVVKAANGGIPIVDLANTIRSPHITSRVASSFQNMGLQIGAYLVELQKKKGKPVNVAWFPGPDGAGWVEAGVKGFAEAVEGKPITLVDTKYGDTGRSTQSKLIATVLDEHGQDLDFIVGTAPTAEAAVPLLRRRKLSDSVQVLSYYFTPGIDRGIRQGIIEGAPTDSTVFLGKISVDTMVRRLENRDYFKHVAPTVVIVNQDNIKKWNPSGTLPPRGFRPTFSVNE
jgi:protein TorT